VYPRFPLKENYRGPAGGLFINMHDLSKIVRILINDGVVDGIRILKKATVDLMHQIHWFGQSKSYKAKGLQLKFIDFSRRTLKGHTGSAYGAVSYLFVNREEKLGICFVTNGGYYRRAKQMLDIMENTLSSFLKHYWPIRKKKYCLTADLQTMWGCLNDRIIVFDNPILKDDDIYLTVKNIADIFDIVPITTDSQVILKFGRRQLATTSEVLSLKAVCAKFRVKFHFKDNHLKVVY
ncbi:MAG: serine hydrolase, partial [Endomicrobiaceae bacterium]|nr:serine hydrolase [Endomicrobiaceae bacterium]